MKSNNRIIIISIVVVLLVSGIIYLITKNKSNTTSEKQKTHFIWTPQLNYLGKQPYDLGVFRKIISNKYKNNYNEISLTKAIRLDSLIILEDPKNTVYFATGKYAGYSELEFKKLKEFAKNGGIISIAAENVDSNFLKLIQGLDYYYKNAWVNIQEFDNSSAELQFTNESFDTTTFKFTYTQFKSEKNYNWSCFKSRFVSYSNGFTTLAKINNIPYFIRIPYGQGFFYLHLNPIVFSNYFMRYQSAIEYTKNYLHYFDRKKCIYDYSASAGTHLDFTDSKDKSLLSWLNKEKPLYYAWIIVLIIIVCLVFISTRRKQRPIPVINLPENNSLSFLETVGEFHYASNNSTVTFHKQYQLWLAYVKHYLHIRVDRIPNKDEIQLISQKSGVPHSIIEKIVSLYTKHEIIYQNHNTKLVIELYESIQKFYILHRNNEQIINVKN